MADFKTAFQLTMGVEGGYANNPSDTGGETYAGISRRYNPTWAGWPIIDELKTIWPISKLDSVLAINAELQSLVRAKYKTDYWDINELDLVRSQSLANELFDTGVNMGTSTAAKFLQRALNMANRNQKLYRDITVDGVVGPITLSLVNNHPNTAQLYKLLNGLQVARYISIMESNPAQEVFATTWLSRVDFVKVVS